MNRTNSNKGYGPTNGVRVGDIVIKLGPQQGHDNRKDGKKNGDVRNPKESVTPVEVSKEKDGRILLRSYSAKTEDVQWVQSGLVATIFNGEAIPIVQNRITDTGFNDVVIIPLGADKVFVRSTEGVDVLTIVSNAEAFFKLVFSNWTRWKTDVLSYQRGAWVRLYGVPLHAWNVNFFKLCVLDCGRFLRADSCSADKDRLDFAQVLIATSDLDIVNRVERILVDGSKVEIKIVEEWGYAMGEDTCLFEEGNESEATQSDCEEGHVDPEARRNVDLLVDKIVGELANDEGNVHKGHTDDALTEKHDDILSGKGEIEGEVEWNDAILSPICDRDVVQSSTSPGHHGQPREHDSRIGVKPQSQDFPVRADETGRDALYPSGFSYWGGGRFVFVGISMRLNMLMNVVQVGVANLRGLSDHCSLVLSVNVDDWGPRPSRMLKCWRDVPGYSKFVKDKWSSLQVDGCGGFVLKEKLKMIKAALKDWHATHAQNLPSRIDSLKGRLVVLDQKGEVEHFSATDLDELCRVTSDIHSLSRMNASITWQQSRSMWLKEGDANSKYFHSVLAGRRRGNAISVIQVDGVTLEGVNSIRHAVFSHFVTQFKVQSLDRWQLQPDPVIGYTVRGAYQLLTAQGSATVAEAETLIWHPQVPLKLTLVFLVAERPSQLTTYFSLAVPQVDLGCDDLFCNSSGSFALGLCGRKEIIDCSGAQQIVLISCWTRSSFSRLGG
ncbi:hypothetical protein TSUD_211670 [Trifolium subterraneum]|uniref:Uncharacterized protein n=1 Tax=Trifolium subterraneum TaxID=3900 RepID=A0A2Z6N2K7_TRISU|nr:hypothetical protein TSUD_211670 [Trifolium subterraneum]